MRPMSPKRFCYVAFLAAFLPVSLHAQEPARVTVTVTVLNSVTGEPIQGVTASVEDLGWELATNSAGVFVFSDIPLGPHQLSLRKEGYETESGRLAVDKAGDMVIRMNPVGGPGTSEMSRIGGTVRDQDGGNRLEGVAVRFPGLNLTGLTNQSGRFSFQDIPPGEHSIEVEMLGYSTREETVVVAGGKILTLDFTLAVEPIELDPIEVSVESRSLDLEVSGFYTRRLETSGHFITREKIEERAPLYTSDLFRGMAGVKVMSTGYVGDQYAILLNGSRTISAGKLCYPAVYLDGQVVHPGGEIPAFLDNIVHPEEVAGIEVYNSAASMPVQYNFQGACGVIVIWTGYRR